MQPGLLCTPLLGFHKYTLHQWKGLLYGPVQPGDRGFDRVSQNRVDKIYADDHQDEVRAHVHGQYFIDVIDFFKPSNYFPDAHYDFFVGTFSDQETFCLRGEQDGGSGQDQTDDNGGCAVKVKAPGNMAQKDSEKCRDKTQNRSGILEEYNQNGWVLPAVNGLNIPPLTFCFREFLNPTCKEIPSNTAARPITI